MEYSFWDLLLSKAGAFAVTVLLSVTVGVFLIFGASFGTAGPAFGSEPYVQSNLLKHSSREYWLLLSGGAADAGLFGGPSAQKQQTLFADTVRYCIRTSPKSGLLAGRCREVIAIANESAF